MLELKQTQKLSAAARPYPAASAGNKASPTFTNGADRGHRARDKGKPRARGGGGAWGGGRSPEEGRDARVARRYSPSEDFAAREDKEYPDYENMVKKGSDLRDYLRWQVGLSDFSKEERVWAEWIIENIDDNGYLSSPLQEIFEMSGIPVESLEIVLKKIQKLDPAGVGARSQGMPVHPV